MPTLRNIVAKQNQLTDYAEAIRETQLSLATTCRAAASAMPATDALATISTSAMEAFNEAMKDAMVSFVADSTKAMVDAVNESALNSAQMLADAAAVAKLNWRDALAQNFLTAIKGSYETSRGLLLDACSRSHEIHKQVFFHQRRLYGSSLYWADLYLAARADSRIPKKINRKLKFWARKRGELADLLVRFDEAWREYLRVVVAYLLPRHLDPGTIRQNFKHLVRLAAMKPARNKQPARPNPDGVPIHFLVHVGETQRSTDEAPGAVMPKRSPDWRCINFWGEAVCSGRRLASEG